MTYSVKRIPGEQVIVANVNGEVDNETIHSLFSRSAELLSFTDRPWCHITYFLQEASLNKDKIPQLAETIYRMITRTQNREVPIFFVFIGVMEGVHALAAAVQEQGLHIPVFATIDETMSYVNLKLDSANLKQSMLKPVTQDLQDTLYRKPLVATASSEAVNPGTEHFPDHGVLHLEAVDLNRTLSVFPQKGLLVGRRDSQGFRPDVDFSLWQGYFNGVSRRHAEIKLTNDNRLHLFDRQSANGTFLNGEKLMPNNDYILRDGDEVTFGTLIVRIKFENKA